ncbi:unnamed protein product, partial [Medioppia subpectinata]
TINLTEYKEWVINEKPEFVLKSLSKLNIEPQMSDYDIDGYPFSPSVIRFYKETFEELGTIGSSGGFGTVVKVKRRFADDIYVVKIIEFKESNYDYMYKLFGELRCLVQIPAEYVVQYYNSWFEHKFLYIQLEYCSHTLKDIIALKGPEFGRL